MKKILLPLNIYIDNMKKDESSEVLNNMNAKYLCRKCQKDLKEIPNSDPFALFGAPRMFFCENEKCKLFGLVTVVGIKEEEE